MAYIDGIPTPLLPAAATAREVIVNETVNGAPRTARLDIGLFTALISATSIFVTATTKAQLDGLLNYPAYTGALVVADPVPARNGVYIKTGASGSGSWLFQGISIQGPQGLPGLPGAVRPGDMPVAFVSLNTGGDPNLVPQVDTNLSPPQQVADGRGLQLSDGRQLWTKLLFAVEAGRVLRARWRFTRNTAATNSESVDTIITWYDPGRATTQVIGTTHITDAGALGTVREVVAYLGDSATLAALGITQNAFARPNGSIYAKAGIVAAGTPGTIVVTDLELVDVTDVVGLQKALVDEAKTARDAEKANADAISAEATTARAAEKVLSDGLAGFTKAATDTDQINRTLSALKYVAPLNAITALSNGATYWNGSSASGATETSGGLRVPQGQTGSGSLLNQRIILTPAQVLPLAGRPTRFVAVYRTSIDFASAFKDSGGNSTLVALLQGTANAANVRIFQTRADTLSVEADVVLTGSETIVTVTLFVAPGTTAVASEATALLYSAGFFANDPTGQTEIMAAQVAPLPLKVDNLIAAARVRQTLLNGARAGLAYRDVVVPQGRRGAGTLLIGGAPVAGLQAGTVATARFRFLTSTALPETILQAGGGTIEMTDGSQIGAVVALTTLAPTVLEGAVTFTATGNERFAEFYLKVADTSTVRSGAAATISLRQVFVEITATDPTTTASAQVQRLMEGFRARLAEMPERFRDYASASPLSDGDYATIRQATAALRTGGDAAQPNRVIVLPGIYTSECSDTLTIAPADHVEIVCPGRDAQIIQRFPDDTPNQDLISIFTMVYSGRLSGIRATLRNGRYVNHIEGGDSGEAAVQIIEDCEFIHEGSTNSPAQGAIGIGQHDGNEIQIIRTSARGTNAAIGLHNNINGTRGARVLIAGGQAIATNDGGLALAITSCGAGVLSTVEVCGETISGLVLLQDGFLNGSKLENHKANRYEYQLVVRDSSPFEWLSSSDVDALVLTSAAGSSSAVGITNSAAIVLFGRVPDIRDGASDMAARLISYHAITVKPGEADPGVTLAARLGDRRSSPLSLGILWDGSSAIVTITLDQDYSTMSNAAIVLHLNLRLAAAMGGNAGGRGFSIERPYTNRAPVYQVDREGIAVNAASPTIRKGMALAWVGRRVRVMTAEDARSAFAGIALDDAVRTRPVRFLKPDAWVGQAHLLFDGNPGFAQGTQFQVSGAAPGYLVAGTNRPLLTTRSIEPHGACFEILRAA